MLKPRDYQLRAIEAVENAWDSGMLRPAVVLPTGSGKTITFAHLISRRKGRSLVLVHRDELVRQAVDKIKMIGLEDVGVVKAGRNETDARVIVASFQTLFNENRLKPLVGNIDTVVVDECHHAAAPAFLRVLDSFSTVPTVGFTATMSRSDDIGLGDVWQDVVYHRDILWGIINGFLVDVEAETLTIDGLNLADVARSRGDYQEGDLGRALVASGAGPVIADNYPRGRQGLLFCPTVECAFDFADDFNAAGIVTEVVHGGTPLEERQEIYKRYQDKEVDVISSVMVLTEGFDMPQAEVAVIARPTQSRGLYIQLAGRVLRPFPGKEKAKILDVVGLHSTSLRSIVDLSETEIEPRKGKTLREMYEADLEEESRVERDVLEGKTTTKVRKLFDASTSAWLKTEKGTWFLPTKECYVFLYPEEGGFKVGRTGTTNTMSGGRWLKDEILELPFAMAWAEQLAEEIDPSVSSRTASWRKKREKASDKQKMFADSIGVSYPSGVRKSDLSDMISIKIASRLLDR